MTKNTTDSLYRNTKSWQDSSDGWVKTMTTSKENKEKYQEYIAECLSNMESEPVAYRDWLKKKESND